MSLYGLDAHWFWLIGAALLGILEVFIPGIFLAWLSAAAVLTGILVALLPLSLPFQFALFGLFAMAAVFGGRRHYERNPVPSSDPMLNERTARLIGQKVLVVTAIEGGEGRVKVGDGVWTARGPDAPAGARVTVTGADGNCLTVASASAPLTLDDGSSGSG